MPTRTALLCALGAIFTSVAVATDESLLKDYTRRELVIHKVSSIYDEYRNTYPQHKEKRQRLLKSFMILYESNFNGSDQWLLNNLVSEDGIVEEFMKSRGFHFPETTAFLKSASKLFVVASLQRIRHEAHRGNDSEAERVGNAIDTGVKQLEVKSDAALDYIRTSAYRAQFKVDAQALARQNAGDVTLPDKVVKLLKAKFPFRSWVAVLIDASKENVFCSSGDIFSTSIGSRRLMVFEVASTANSNRNLATQRMNKVDGSLAAGLYSCDNRAKSILHNEAQYKCSQKAFRLAGVALSEGGLPRWVSSDPKLVSSKKVYRARLTFGCQAHYQILFLA